MFYFKFKYSLIIVYLHRCLTTLILYQRKIIIISLSIQVRFTLQNFSLLITKKLLTVKDFILSK